MRGVGALLQNDGPVASRLSLAPLHHSQGQVNPKGVKLCVCAQTFFLGKHSPRQQNQPPLHPFPRRPAPLTQQLEAGINI